MRAILWRGSWIGSTRSFVGSWWSSLLSADSGIGMRRARVYSGKAERTRPGRPERRGTRRGRLSRRHRSVGLSHEPRCIPPRVDSLTAAGADVAGDERPGRLPGSRPGLTDTRVKAVSAVLAFPGLFQHGVRAVG